MNLREALTEQEQKIYDLFLQTEKKEPENMWQLMQYGSYIQRQVRDNSAFWGGIFGL